jgi:hypothetical protein
MPGKTPVAVLATIEDAEHERSTREAEIRIRVANPFICCHSHAHRSRLPEPVFCDWLRDAGLEPPKPTSKGIYNWILWWNTKHKKFTPEQISHVWAGLDLVRFFEVGSREAGQTAYAVTQVNWEYNDNWMVPADEGGFVVKVFRKFAAAEKYRREQEEREQERHAPDAPHRGMAYETTRWAGQDQWPFTPQVESDNEDEVTFSQGDRVPHYEIVEIELNTVTK